MHTGTWIAAAVLALAGPGLSAEELKPKEARDFGWATAARIDRGETGDDLEKGVREDLQRIREGKGPGEGLKHGLAEKDAENFGRFVNEQLAKGLRGRDLADAIHKEHALRKEARPPEKGGGREGKPEGKEPKGPPPGHGHGHGKGPKK